MFAGGTCLSSIHVKYRTCGFPAEHRQEHSTASVGLSSFDSVSCCHLSSRKMMCTQPDVHVKIKENVICRLRCSDARCRCIQLWIYGSACLLSAFCSKLWCTVFWHLYIKGSIKVFSHTQAKHNDVVTMSLLPVHQSSFLGPIWPRTLRNSVQ